MDNETIWSQTLLDGLYKALEKNKTDQEIKKIIGKLYASGYNKTTLIEQVTKKVSASAGARLNAILSGKTTKSTASATTTTGTNNGILGRFKNLFK